MKLVPRSRPSFSTFPFVFHFVPLLKVLTVVTRAFATQFCSRLRAAELQIYCPRTLGRSTTLLQLGETFMVTVCKGWSINQPFLTVVSHFHQRREIDAVYAVACTPTNTVSSTTAPKHPHQTCCARPRTRRSTRGPLSRVAPPPTPPISLAVLTGVLSVSH